MEEIKALKGHCRREGALSALLLPTMQDTVFLLSRGCRHQGVMLETEGESLPGTRTADVLTVAFPDHTTAKDYFYVS